MNFKRFIRKNWIPILLVLIAILVVYYGSNLEAFQTETIPQIGDKCISNTDRIDGRCTSGFKINKDTLTCDRIFTVKQMYQPNATKDTYTCSDGYDKIGDFKCQKKIKDYICSSGYEAIGNMLCAKVGTIKCPKNFYHTSSLLRGICMKCPSGSYINTPNLCKIKDSGESIKGEKAQGICSV